MSGRGAAPGASPVAAMDPAAGSGAAKRLPGTAPPFQAPERFPLAVLPTPLVPAPRLARALGIDTLLIKRDDLTGLAFAGNKARPLEMLVAAALAGQADILVTGGAPGSNFCAAAAAAALKAGLGCHLVMAGAPGPPTPALALARAFGAEVSWTGSAERASVDAALSRAAARLAAAGRRPHVIPRGGATPLGAAGFALAAVELRDQLAQRGIAGARVVAAVGSGGTMAGLVAGNTLLGGPWTLVGGSASRPPGQAAERVLSLARECCELLGAAAPPDGHAGARIVDVRGPGHGRPTAAGAAAAEQAMRTEGLMLDPVYTAKALPLAAAAGLAGDGGRGEAVVFWHTGGALDVVAAALEGSR